MSDQYPPPSNPSQSGGEQNWPGGDPNAPGSAPGYGAPVPPPAKKRSTGKIVGSIVGVLALLGVLCAIGAFFLIRNLADETVDAKVGDCLAGDSISSTGTDTDIKIRVVSCSDSNVKHKVYGRIPDKTFAEAEAGEGAICEPYIKDGAESYIWLGNRKKLTEAAPVVCVGPPK